MKPRKRLPSGVSKKKAASGARSQEQRRESGARVVASLSLSQDALAELDARRGEMSRGAFVEQLLHATE